MPDNLDQHGNVVGGHLVGGNLNINNYNPQPVSQLHRLYTELESESEEASDFDGYIDALLRYVTSVDTGIPLGVEEKLRRGGRAHEVARAVRLKEAFNKKLMKLRLSKTAQKVLAHLLGRVETQFHYRIKPHIDLDAPRADVDARVLVEVVDNLRSMLGSNPLDIDDGEISGMIYYLTAMCHLRWHKEA
jgi:hypothetical protein